MAGKRNKNPTSFKGIQGFIKRLRNDELESLPRVTLWLGDELFLKKRALEILEERIVADQVREFVYERLDGAETHGDTVAGAARSMPMMSRHKLIVVDRVDQMRAGDLGGLPDYCRAPVEFTTLVLLGEALPKGKFWTDFPGQLQSFDRFGSGYSRPSADEARLFAQTINQIILEPFNKRIDPDAIETLVGLAGSSLSDLKSHLEKLALHMGEGPATLGEAEVLEGVRDGSKAQLDALAMAIVDRKHDEALQEMAKAMEDGASPNYLLAILSGWFRLLVRMKSLQRMGVAKTDMVGALRSPPYLKRVVQRQVDSLYPRLDRFTWPELSDAMDALTEIDLRMKSEPVDPRELIEAFALGSRRPHAAGSANRA